LIEPELMAAALALLSESGPEGFTVRAIARRANVAPMAIYNHFEGKDGLLDAIWSEGFTLLRQALASSANNREDPLVNTGLAYRRFALTHPSHYTVMFMHRFVGFTPTIPAAQIALETFQTLVDLVTSAQSRGLFGSFEAADAAQLLWSACHGFVSLEMMNINFAEERDRTFLAFLRGIERGLAASLD
jgi:AcrR family transcriptional regulator